MVDCDDHWSACLPDSIAVTGPPCRPGASTRGEGSGPEYSRTSECQGPLGDLGLEQGKPVTVIIKSTEVMLATK
jgi:hypothetical protein